MNEVEHVENAGGVGERRNLKVLLVGDFAASLKGNFSVAEELARRLAQRGADVATTSSEASPVRRVVDMVVSSWNRRRAIDVAVVDVYSGRAFLWAEAVCAVLQSARVPVLLVLRGGGLARFAQRRPRRVARLLKSVSGVVALSRFLGEGLAEYANTIHVLPNPVELGAYPYVHRSAATARLVWLRTFDDLYNPTMALRVLARLLPVFPDASLAMVGSDRGSMLARTRRVADELRIAHQVDFVGPVPKAEVPHQLARGDVFLNTPRVDNVPISLLEAMACGMCVVSTDVGGIPYLVEEGSNALLVPSDDDEAMAAAVARICREPPLAAILSSRARLLAEAHSWNGILPRWEALLETTAAEGWRRKAS